MFGDSDFSQNLPTSYIIGDNEKIDLIEKHFGSLLLRAPWAKVFKKSVFDQNSLYFNQNIRLGEDTILVLNYIYHCESISLIPNIHYLYYFQKNKMESYKLTARDYYNSISLIEHSMMQLAPKKRIPGSLYIIRTIFKDAFYQALWNNGMDFAKENSLTYIKLRMWQFFPITSIVIRLRKSLVMLLWPIVYRNTIIKNSYEQNIR